jgi:Zn-finger nucleic acid-binding protein
MRQVDLGDTELMECDRCGGMWVDAETFERICGSREVRASVLHHGSPSEQSAQTTEIRYRPCVRCGTMMNRLNFGRLSGTVVDVCKGHGTFLDRGELHRIVRFIEDGGLERARQRQLDDIKEEEKRLRSLQHSGGSFGHGVENLDVLDGFDLIDFLSYLTHH